MNSKFREKKIGNKIKKFFLLHMHQKIVFSLVNLSLLFKKIIF